MRKRIFGFSERDWPDVRKLLEEFRKVGRTLRHPKPVEEKRGTASRPQFHLGKPAQALTAGALTSPNNVIDIWEGPANPSDAATGKTVEADYATQDFATTDYVAVTKYRGYWYVTCFMQTPGP